MELQELCLGTRGDEQELKGCSSWIVHIGPERLPRGKGDHVHLHETVEAAQTTLQGAFVLRQ